jgi:hypothetical protein
MRHIKKFETKRIKKSYINPTPYLGDYVICNVPNNSHAFRLTFTGRKIIEFLPTVIGKVDRYNNNEYGVLYNEEDIPDEFKWYFVDDEYPITNYVKWFNRQDIVEWSKDRGDLEAIFAAKKYNL